jgi:outer membrane protein OmpA-like peptidoglycan-associated protein
MRTAIITIALVLVAGLAPARGQSANPTQQQVSSSQVDVPIYRMTVVGHSTPAINYRYRSGDTTIDFLGTPLLPRAKGRAKVETKRGFSDIDAHFGDLEPASRFGPEYLTYVMWAITPDGRAANLGEVLLNGDDSKLHVTTDMQAFALVVTAEPYFAVTQPSDVVVLENEVRPETTGAVERVVAKYELLKRGSYVMNGNATSLAARTFDPAMPLELREARNAVDLARLAGADRFALETFEKASQSLRQAEEYQRRDAGKKPVIMMARAAAQTAEDARLIAVQRQIEQQTAAANDAAARRELEILAQARAESARARKAEADRAAAEDARARAESAADRLAQEKTATEQALTRSAQEKAAAEQALARTTQEKDAAEQALARSAQERAAAEDALARTARERAELEAQRVAAERARLEAEQATQALAQQKAQADAARQASEAEAARARSAAEQAEHDKVALRERLRQQLNVILQTRESARGLIVNMSDVLFDSGKATLRPGAREKLAKVSGIILAYPGLNLEVEGHTDSVGPASYNMDLSERRANTVRAFLSQQGISTASIVARGFGKEQPVATNGTAAGRQQNRRVELIVSGTPIQ